MMKKIIKLEISNCLQCPFSRSRMEDYKCTQSGYAHKDIDELYKICPLNPQPKKKFSDKIINFIK